MKRFALKYWICVSILGLSVGIKAQNVAINGTGALPHPAAILDLSSDDKGVLIPRMTTGQREAIVSPPMGLLVFDTDSRSLWFYTTVWNQVTNSGSMGNAGGDLDGTYPDPLVAKIQGHPVSALTPNDKQALKWDADAFMWRGMNDSLSFPFAAESAASGNMFFLNNTNNSFGSSSTILAHRVAASGITLPFHSAVRGDASGAVGVVGTSLANAGVYGKSSQTHGIVGESDGGNATAGVRGAHGASGITPGTTAGVWGDNQSGIGTLGMSNSGVGVYGLSNTNHGVYGYSISQGWAGVKGSHANTGGIGVYGDVANGTGVLGEVQTGGTAVIGRALGSAGIAGRFVTEMPANGDTTLIAETQGMGALGVYQVWNEENPEAGIQIEHSGIGEGVHINLNNEASEADVIHATTEGQGMAIYGRSHAGTAAKFEITNAANAHPAMIIGNSGVDTTVVVHAANATSSAPALAIAQDGLGKGINVYLTEASNTNAGIRVTTAGNKAIEAVSSGTFGIAVSAQGNGAVAVSANTGQTANNAIAVRGLTGAAVSGGIGVLGEAGVNDPTGIGVKGVAGGAISGGIGVYGEGKSGNPQAIGVKGVNYSHNEDVGAVTGINMVDGVGVYGEALGFDGIGVAGTVGNTGNHSVAAVFTNTYAENNRAVMELITNGKGNGILIDQNNLTSTAPVIRIANSGNSQFLRFENGIGDIKTTLSKEGNLETDGTITVKSNKGIVRNSTSTQMRMEVLTVNIPAGSLAHYDQFIGSIDIDLNFSTAFSAQPTVYIANLVTGGLAGITTVIKDVTTTGCKFYGINYTPYDFNYGATTYKIIAIGPE